MIPASTQGTRHSIRYKHKDLWEERSGLLGKFPSQKKDAIVAGKGGIVTLYWGDLLSTFASPSLLPGGLRRNLLPRRE
ncbi:hypothetical protein VNO77_26033 [Canavalia gladiata]|uniref:Uncharacterized protein n=1 Tax=Canavalia gladiata TaxID=3824 RepID=A0AAN9KVD3_CANGL